jgi:hypothetical protein
MNRRLVTAIRSSSPRTGKGEPLPRYWPTTKALPGQRELKKMLRKTDFVVRPVLLGLPLALMLALPAGPASASEVVNLARLVLTGKWLSAEQRDRMASARQAADNPSSASAASPAGPVSPPLQLALQPRHGGAAL